MWYNIISMIKKIFEVYLRLYIWILVTLGIAKWTKRVNPKKMNNRQNVVFHEAKKRGLSIENLKIKKRHLRFFRVKLNGGYYYFEAVPLGDSYNKISTESASNKWFSKRVLQKAGFNTPHGKIANSLKGALDYVKNKGFPVVIKPLNKSRCMGVTINIKNKNQLKRAISHVKKYGKKFLIEEFLKGENYRVTVVGDKVVGACLRKYPQVVGDGKHTIEELIKIKNKDPRRGEGNGFTLHPIRIDANFTRELLEEQNLSLKSVPQKNQVVVLNKKINLGSGADTEDLTHKIHPKISEISTQVAKTFDAKVLGLDVLAKDISRIPSKNNPVSIIEVNPFPFIDMHHYPYKGRSRNIAAAIWDMIFTEYGLKKIKDH